MKMEGYSFPTLKESDAMFASEKAPEWKDGEVCHRCRVQFTMVQRKHHCRNCGQVFCGKCSAKSSIIPRFGIEKEVRVCDACFDVLTKAGANTPKKTTEDDLPQEYLGSSLAQQSQTPPAKNEQDLQEEEELQLALALSKSEAENKEKERERLRQNYSLYSSSPDKTSSTVNNVETVVPQAIDTSDMDPELARYLNRNYWENKRVEVVKNDPTPSAPVAQTDNKAPIKMQEQYQNGETDDNEQFLNALRSSVEIFVNRMKSNHMRGRIIANDSSVQSLFMTINAMHPQLLKHMQEQEDLRGHYEMLQDKLVQLKDAREALDALREDYREKQRQEEEERERQRQIQLAQKLEVMRQKKKEYLEYQRQVALQKMQEYEIDLQRRLEKQKHLTQMRQMQQYAYSMPGYPPQGISPGGSVEGSPVHYAQQPGVYTQQQQGAPPNAQSQQVYNTQGQMGPPSTTYQGPPPGFQPPTSNYQPDYPNSAYTGTTQPPNTGAPPPQQPSQGQGQQVDYQQYNIQSQGQPPFQGQYPPGSTQGTYVPGMTGQNPGPQQNLPKGEGELISFD